MALLSAVDVSLNLSGKPLLDRADLHLEVGERVCLVGRNGAGKSSLMALLAGDMLPDSGTVTRAPGIRFGHMPQAVPERFFPLRRRAWAGGASRWRRPGCWRKGGKARCSRSMRKRPDGSWKRERDGSFTARC